MNRQTKFEQLWAERHGIPAESLEQYRFKDKDGYRLPNMAAHYRTFCDALDSIVIELPTLENSSSYHDGADQRDAKVNACREAIEAAGIKVKS